MHAIKMYDEMGGGGSAQLKQSGSKVWYARLGVNSVKS